MASGGGGAKFIWKYLLSLEEHKALPQNCPRESALPAAPDPLRRPQTGVVSTQLLKAEVLPRAVPLKAFITHDATCAKKNGFASAQKRA